MPDGIQVGVGSPSSKFSVLGADDHHAFHEDAKPGDLRNFNSAPQLIGQLRTAFAARPLGAIRAQSLPPRATIQP